MDEFENLEGTLECDFSDVLAAKSALEQEKVTLRSYPEMKLYESPLNWLKDLEDLTSNKVLRAIKLISAEVDGNVQDLQEKLRHTGVECVSLRVAQGFLLALLQRFEECQEVTSRGYHELLTMMERKFIEKEHFAGLNHLLHGVTVYNHLQEKFRLQQLEDAYSPDFLDDLENFILSVRYMGSDYTARKYDGPTKAVILFAKHKFMWWFKKPNSISYENNFKLLDKVIELDPSFYWWYLSKYYQYASQRKLMMSGFSKPSNGEVDVVCKAWHVAPEEPMVLVTYCMCLGELMKANGWTRPVPFGGQRFDTAEEVIDFTTGNMMKVCRIIKENVWVNIRIATFFSRTLPPQCRNYGLAKECLQRNLVAHPDSHQSLRRLGMLIFDQERSFVNAAPYLARAVELDPKNFTLRVELVKMYLGAPNVCFNDKKIFGLLFNNLEESDLSQPNLASLYFLRGCFFFLAHKFSNYKRFAGVEWIKSCHADHECWEFMKLDVTIKNWGWRGTVINANSVWKAVNEVVESGLVRAEHPAVLILRDILGSIRYQCRETRRYEAEKKADGSKAQRPSAKVANKNKTSLYSHMSLISPSGSLPKKYFNSCNSGGSEGSKVIASRQPFGPDGTNGFTWNSRGDTD